MTHSRERGRPAHRDVLTPAEWRVAEGVRHGMTNRMIAARQGVSIDAIKFHVANILAKLGFARRSELRHWAGISADSLLAEKGIHMDGQRGLRAIGQIARSVADVAAARRWYGEALGLRHLYSFQNLAFFDCGGVRLMLTQGEGAADSIVYFSVADIHAAQALLAGRGVEFVSAPHLIHRHADGTEEWMAFFNDLEGRPLALMAIVPGALADSEEGA